MARGKYATRSAVRRDEAETEAQLSSYQHRVARLTAENKDLRNRLAEQERTAKAVERRLRAERDEGVAPQVEALRLALDAEKNKRNEHKRQVAATVGRLLKADQARISADGWQQLLAALGVSVGEALPDEPYTRDTKRHDAKSLRLRKAIEDMGHVSGTKGPAPRRRRDADG